MAEDVWRGCRFSLKEIEMATNGLAKENVIGMWDNWIVYRGILLDNTRVAVKKLVSSRYGVFVSVLKNTTGFEFTVSAL